MKRIALIVGLAMMFGSVAGASVPRSTNYGRSLHYAGYGNSTVLGDCALAAAADVEQTLTHRKRNYSMVVAAYQVLSPEDNGVVTSDLFSYWEITGIAGRTINPPVAIVNTRHQIKKAIRIHHALFANVDVLATTYGNLGLTIDGSAGPVVGEHSVAVIGYNSDGMKVVSWGHKMTLSWAYWSEYGIGAWSVALTR